MNIDKLSTEVLVQDLILEQVDVNDLNLAKLNQRTAFLQALQTRPAILTKVKASNSEHFLNFAINENKELFIYLEKSQYTDTLAQMFLKHRLKKDIEKRRRDYHGENKQQGFSIVGSLDEKIVFNYSHTTPQDDQFYYFDSDFQIPISVRVSIKASLKLNNAVTLINKLDTDVKELGENKIIGMFDETIVTMFKTFFNAYINKQKVSFYALCANLQEIEKDFKKELNDVFKAYGIEVCNFVIKKIAIPDDLQKKIEDLAFQIRQRRADIEADSEFAKKSLEIYEQKLAVEDKYPNSTPALTEYEKDLALKRYLIKQGRMKTEELDHTINLKQELQKTDDELKKKDDIVPEIKAKKNTFKIVFITMLIISAVLSTFILAFNLAVGFFCLAAVNTIFGCLAAFKHDKFKNQEIEIKEGELNYDANKSSSTDESSSN